MSMFSEQRGECNVIYCDPRHRDSTPAQVIGAEAVRIIRDRFSPAARRTEKAERDMSPFLDLIDMCSGNVDGITISCLSAQRAKQA